MRKKLTMRKIKPVPVVHILRRIKNERIEKWDKTKIRKIEPVLLVHISENLTLWTAQIYAGLQAESTNNQETLSLFCLKLAKDIYLHESGRPATDVATERKKTPKPTKPTHFPFLNIALSVVHCCSPLWSSCLNSEILRFITTHNIMIQDPTSADGFSPI